MNELRPVFRRPKQDPDSDALHTLRVGLALFVLLWLLLPLIIP